MQIIITPVTPKYKAASFSFYFKDIADSYAGQFPMIEKLDVELREHPPTDLDNFYPDKRILSPDKKSCRLVVYVYPGTGPEAFFKMLSYSLDQLKEYLQLVVR